jgi:hypothetical protein
MRNGVGPINLSVRPIGACACLLLLAGGGQGAFGDNYHFNGRISQQVLENYLSRSITMTELYRSPGNQVENIGASSSAEPSTSGPVRRGFYS